ncbi:YoaK family protein [Streptomyces sp. NPDC006173]|uniref:YoaK family protein n=1 Tax=Streptomyces sp. NPDC006173 TaxID=3155349 RepID=UPI0033D5168C
MREESGPPLSADRRERQQTVVMTTLTVLAGAVDAVSFLTMGHVFTALATGNVLFLAFAVAGEGQVTVGRTASALAAFVLGAAAGALVTTGLVARRRHWFAAALAIEGVLLALAGLTALWRHGSGSLTDDPDYLVIAIVAFAMGLRADTALRAAVPGMPTQLAQMSLVRLIHGLAGALPATPHRDTIRVRLLATVVGIFAGGVLGALMTPWGTGHALLALAAAVLIVAGLNVLLARQGLLAPELDG